jgi:hypothetical protein
MFSVLRPSARDIARFLAASRDLPLSISLSAWPWRERIL